MSACLDCYVKANRSSENENNSYVKGVIASCSLISFLGFFFPFLLVSDPCNKIWSNEFYVSGATRF